MHDSQAGGDDHPGSLDDEACRIEFAGLEDLVRYADDYGAVVGRELHDSIAQELSALGMQVQVLVRNLQARNAPEADDAREVLGGLRRALGSLRAFLRGFVPCDMVEPDELNTALEGLMRSWCEESHLECDFQADASVRLPDRAAATQLLRLAQATLHEMARHAKASTLHVRLAATQDGATELSVECNGHVPRERLESTGMRLLTCRAEQFRGRVSVESHAESTRLVCRIESA